MTLSGRRTRLDATLDEVVRASRYTDVPASFAAVGVFTAAVWSNTDTTRVTVWLLASLVAHGAGLWLALRGSRLATDLDWRRWLNQLVATHTAGGLLWGTTMWLVPSPVPETHALTCLVFAAAISVGGVSAFSPRRRLAAAHFIPMWLPLSAALALEGHWILSLGALLLLGFISEYVNKANRVVTESIGHRHRAEELAAELERSRDHLAEMAITDHLTGILNRSGLLARFGDEPLPQDTTVMFVDLDNFKLVNDTLGHQQGDAILSLSAERLSASVREPATISRLGGDEFVVVIENGGLEDDQATALGERIVAALEAPLPELGTELSVSASVGIVRADGTQAIPELLARADLAMYAAKSNETSRIRHYEPEMTAAIEHRLIVESDLRRAMSRSELEMWAQPIVRLTDEAVMGVELLSRWRTSDGTILMPGVFMAVAEETGLHIQISHLALAEARRLLQEWETDPDRSEWSVTINISTAHLMAGLDTDLARVVRELANPSRLVVELTESRLADSDAEIAVMERLRDLGVGLAIDDFGAGYSSLNYLRHLPASVVKIDRSFVAELEDERSRAVIAATNEIADSFGLDVIAEGVETAAQLATLKEIGVEFGQGFLWSTARPLAEMRQLAVSKASMTTAADRPTTGEGSTTSTTRV